MGIPVEKLSNNRKNLQIELHFCAFTVYNAPRMQLPTPGSGIATPKNVIGLSVLFLLVAAVFGVLNGQKIKSLHTMVAHADAARDDSDRRTKGY